MEKVLVHKNELIAQQASLPGKLTDFGQLIKIRLSALVVFSSVVTYLTASQGQINWIQVLVLAISGLLVTGSANGINQIIERDYDKLMSRTLNRPIASGRMSILSATVMSLIMGVLGVFLIARYLNAASGFLAFISLISYAFVYTPLKRVSPISVFVGAFPGALPTMLGWVAYTGSIDTGAIVLFLIQFVWQFPHFWSIAWLLEDDYKKAGFKMLPFTPGRTRKTALQCLAFSVLLIPIGMLPAYYGISGVVSSVIAVAAALYFSYYAFRLFRSCQNSDAKKLMLAAIVYLPLVQLAFLFDKL